jgi:uncharacterized protein
MKSAPLVRFAASISMLILGFAPVTVLRCEDNSNITTANGSARRQAAAELVKYSDSKRLLEQMHLQIKQGFSAMMQQLGVQERDRPLIERYNEKLTALMLEQLGWDKLEQPMIDIYARVYTEQELREVTKFYQSPAGQSFLTKMPDLLRESMQLAQQNMQTVLPKLKALEQEATGEIRLALATRDCKDMQPVEPKTVSGRWRSLDYPHVNHLNYKQDGTFEGSTESLGKIVSRYGGAWVMEGNRRIDTYAFHTSSASASETKDVDEILAVGCGILTLRNQRGITARYARESNE